MQTFWLAVACIAGVNAAHAQEAVDKARAAAFDNRLFAGPLGQKTYACFVRRYDAGHLALHPKQKVSAMKLLVTAEDAPEDKAVSFVVGNIQNHLDGVGGPDHVTIALVIHGQALRAFHTSSANPDLSRRVGQFSKAGIELAACGNTMKSQNVGLADLLPGFIAADRGGVVRIAELQSQGYLYLRP